LPAFSPRRHHDFVFLPQCCHLKRGCHTGGPVFTQGNCANRSIPAKKINHRLIMQLRHAKRFLWQKHNLVIAFCREIQDIFTPRWRGGALPARFPE
jgi:hypothetical protein